MSGVKVHASCVGHQLGQNCANNVTLCHVRLVKKSNKVLNNFATFFQVDFSMLTPAHVPCMRFC